MVGRIIAIKQTRVKVTEKLAHSYPSKSPRPLGQLFKVKRLDDNQILHLLVMYRNKQSLHHCEMASRIQPHANIVQMLAYTESGNSIYVL